MSVEESCAVHKKRWLKATKKAEKRDKETTTSSQTSEIQTQKMGGH